MEKRLWMLCWGLMVMAMAMAVNVSAVEAANHHTWEVFPNMEKIHRGVDYYEGRQYRITATYPEKDGSYLWVRPEEVGSVLEPMWTSFNDTCAEIMFVLVSAPANTRFANIIKINQKDSYLSGDVLLDRVSSPESRGSSLDKGPWNTAYLSYINYNDNSIIQDTPEEIVLEPVAVDIDKPMEEWTAEDFERVSALDNNSSNNEDSSSLRTVIVSDVQPLYVSFIESGNTITVYEYDYLRDKGKENVRPIFVMERIR